MIDYSASKQAKLTWTDSGEKVIDYSASKQAKLTWTDSGEKAFTDIKDLISKSPTLYFISDTAPIILMTDASDYGVGGYLYQLIDGTKQLVALVSKALTIDQLKWSVIQKEAYAIYSCCTALDKQLRDRKFTILTDHKNLTFIKQGSNPMVVRWHLALQELDFTLEYVKGVENTIADAMSRLCINNILLYYADDEDQFGDIKAGMYSCRELIEWMYRDIKIMWAITSGKYKLKLLEDFVQTVNLIDTCWIFNNALNCMNGNETPQFFKTKPPSFATYTSLGPR
jgi:RNase H-like domain found in reverse transcriptase